MSFSSLSLNATLVNTITELGYSLPTPIQSEAIPVILAKQDVMAGAQTGTGKTAAFALPILHRYQWHTLVAQPVLRSYYV